MMVVNQASSWLLKYMQLRDGGTMRKQVVQHIGHWIPSNFVVLKFNMGGTIFREEGWLGSGAVIHDNQGNCLASFSH